MCFFIIGPRTYEPKHDLSLVDILIICFSYSYILKSCDAKTPSLFILCYSNTCRIKMWGWILLLVFSLAKMHRQLGLLNLANAIANRPTRPQQENLLLLIWSRIFVFKGLYQYGEYINYDLASAPTKCWKTSRMYKAKKKLRNWKQRPVEMMKHSQQHTLITT
jgi:hypothetical protein